MRLSCLFWAVISIAISTSVHAKDFVTASGILSNENFHRLVSCGAAPGKPCKHAVIHWPKHHVTISFVDIDKRINEDELVVAKRALRNAINQINAAGAGIRLKEVGGKNADIEVFLSQGRHVSRHALAKGTGRALGSRPIGVSRMFFEDFKINKALIVVAAGNDRRTVWSVMLEEVVQALGMPTDIRNEAYRNSIFSETGNRTIRLVGQDAELMRIHYPAR